MRLILDTHVLIWGLVTLERLPPRWNTVIQSGENDVLFSAVSVWEITIKAALGRADFQLDPVRIVGLAKVIGFVELPVSASAATRVAGLPPHHRDPFDRLLVAQAIDEGAQRLTADAALGLYGSHVLTLA